MIKRKKIIISSIFALAVLAAAIFIFYSAAQEAARSRRIKEDIENLRREAERIRKDNSKLEERIVYFETQEFQEREAKEKLNFQKEGEQVVIVRPSPFQESKDGEVFEKEESAVRSGEKLPNYKKWWNYFFSYRAN